MQRETAVLSHLSGALRNTEEGRIAGSAARYRELIAKTAFSGATQNFESLRIWAGYVLCFQLTYIPAKTTRPNGTVAWPWYAF
jgi:hypothetical protein